MSSKFNSFERLIAIIINIFFSLSIITSYMNGVYAYEVKTSFNKADISITEDFDKDLVKDSVEDVFFLDGILLNHSQVSFNRIIMDGVNIRNLYHNFIIEGSSLKSICNDTREEDEKLLCFTNSFIAIIVSWYLLKKRNYKSSLYFYDYLSYIFESVIYYIQKLDGKKRTRFVFECNEYVSCF